LLLLLLLLLLSCHRRYLEMQAAYAHSWLCPSSSPVAAACSAAPQAEISSGQWPQPEPYFVLDASAAANAAAAAAAAAGGDVGIALMGSGCVHMQSFVLLDIKWSLQAQVCVWGGGDWRQLAAAVCMLADLYAFSSSSETF
jgi:hypothetical protein